MTIMAPLDWLAIGASSFAANIGSEHVIGLAGQGARTGLSMAHWEFHAWVLVLMAWVLLPFYDTSGVQTLPESLERRFGARNLTYARPRRDQRVVIQHARRGVAP